MSSNPTFFSRLRRLLNNRSGGPAMEFAVLAPVLLVCIVFLFDLANALQQRIRLTEAVRAGGLYALYKYTDTTAIATAVTSAVPDWTDLATPTVTLACFCRTINTETYTAMANCTDNCTTDVQRFVTIVATRPFTPILLTNITDSTATHVVRVE